jgi:hypothetical protein
MLSAIAKLLALYPFCSLQYVVRVSVTDLCIPLSGSGLLHVVWLTGLKNAVTKAHHSRELREASLPPLLLALPPLSPEYLLPRSPRFTCVPPASTPQTQCRFILVPAPGCACWQQCAQAVRRNANQDGVSCTASMAVKKLVRAHRSGLDAVFCLCARAAGASCSLRTWFLLGRVNPPTWYVGASDHTFSRVLVMAA